MSVDSTKLGSKAQDVPFISVEKGGNWHIIACDVRGSNLVQRKILLTQSEPILDLRSIRNGYALAASSEKDIMFGVRRSTEARNVNELKYEFFTLNGSDEIACLDTRVTDRIHLNRRSQAEVGNEPVVDIVVGCARGAVFFYNDIVPQLRRLYSSKGSRNSLQPRKYHWHRKAVHAIKWSRDGKNFSKI